MHEISLGKMPVKNKGRRRKSKQGEQGYAGLIPVKGREWERLGRKSLGPQHSSEKYLARSARGLFIF